MTVKFLVDVFHHFRNVEGYVEEFGYLLACGSWIFYRLVVININYFHVILMA